MPIVRGYILKTQGTTLITDATHNPCLSAAKSVLSQGVLDRVQASSNAPPNIAAISSLYPCVS